MVSPGFEVENLLDPVVVLELVRLDVLRVGHSAVKDHQPGFWRGRGSSVCSGCGEEVNWWVGWLVAADASSGHDDPIRLGEEDKLAIRDVGSIERQRIVIVRLPGHAVDRHVPPHFDEPILGFMGMEIGRSKLVVEVILLRADPSRDDVIPCLINPGDARLGAARAATNYESQANHQGRRSQDVDCSCPPLRSGTLVAGMVT